MSSPRYIPRHLSSHLKSFLGQFPAVLVLGPRQVGKTTFLSHELRGWKRVDLEDPATQALVARDPALFLRDNPSKVWFDEAHRVPELFPALRVAIDGDRKAGRFALSGSATGPLTANASESLAGRIGVLTLHPFSVSERYGKPKSPFLGGINKCRNARQAIDLSDEDIASRETDLREAWFSGGLPEPALLGNAVRRRRWLESYVRLVSERDLQPVRQSLTPVAIRQLLRMLAVRNGQAANISSLAADFSVSARTVKTFLEILEGAFLWYRLEPYTPNIGKRLVRTPKGYIADTGLLHSLLDLRSPAELELHPALGASFEGFVVQNLQAQASLMDEPPRFYHWRTHAGAEVDLVMERGARVIPMEIKHATRISAYDLRGIASFLESFGSASPFGVVLYRGIRARLSARVVAFPVEQAL